MATLAASDLAALADAYDNVADGLSNLTADTSLVYADRRTAYEHAMALRGAAFNLRTQALDDLTAPGLPDAVSLLQSASDAARVLKTIKTVQLGLDVTSDLLSLADALVRRKVDVVPPLFAELGKDLVRAAGIAGISLSGALSGQLAGALKPVGGDVAAADAPPAGRTVS